MASQQTTSSVQNLESSRVSNVSVIVAGNNLSHSPLNITVNVPQSEVGELPASDTELLKETAYDKYRQFKVREVAKPNMEYIHLDVLEQPPMSKIEDIIEDKMVQQFKDCGPRVAAEKVSKMTPVDLLKKGSERIHVVYGQAGCGKTTLLQQMCKALSCGDAESDFNLVLYFPLREKSVSSASDLQSLLKYYGRQDSRLNHAAVAQSMVESKGSGLLLVFDGADEVKDLLRPFPETLINSLLTGDILSEAHIIVSSRPGACPFLQEHSTAFCVVQGFDHNAVTSYVNSFFKAKPATAANMLAELATRPDLLGGAYIPMNCYILCSIFESSSSFPATMTACYQVFVRQMIYRDIQSKGMLRCLPHSLKDFPKDDQILLQSLGKLAFDGLCQTTPTMIFSEPFVRSCIPEVVLPPDISIDERFFKGLIHMHSSMCGYEPVHLFSFLHRAHQEFFAAFHLSQLDEDKQAQFWKMNLFNIFYSVVLRFYAGLTGLSHPKVAKQICCILTGTAEGGSTADLFCKCTSDDPRLVQLFHVLHESQNEPILKEVMKGITFPLKMYNMFLTPLDTMAISYCLRQHSHLKPLVINIDSCTLLSAQCLQHLKSLSNYQFGSILRLDCTNLSTDDAMILSELPQTELHLWVNHTDPSIFSLAGVMKLTLTVRSGLKDENEWPQVKTHLKENTHLHELAIGGCDAFLVNMGMALTSSSSIQKLQLRAFKAFPVDVAAALGTCVSAMTQLRCLHLADFPLSVLKALAARKEPLEPLELVTVGSPGVNWDGLSEDQWQEAAEAAASAKVKKLHVAFDYKSSQRSRAGEIIAKELARNELVEKFFLRGS